MGLTPLKKIPKATLAEFREIPLFNITDEEEAVAMIEKWAEEGALEEELDDIQYILKADPSYNNIKSWCIDFMYTLTKIEYKDKKKRALHPERYEATGT